ncbi:uncharacterized protein LOC123510992 isoform X2 [Portunus trituberculatus]|uniref:uncharacterized protein LOC123510992 isoform X2 n=1 Tax=Portunus trituberculatus TaxID=210409 RepID=UPI001E1CD62F|nr:uncharacterized protein LOC123510992 isoform X2 [Portunus trituberculatus]
MRAITSCPSLLMVPLLLSCCFSLALLPLATAAPQHYRNPPSYSYARLLVQRPHNLQESMYPNDDQALSGEGEDAQSLPEEGYLNSKILQLLLHRYLHSSLHPSLSSTNTPDGQHALRDLPSYSSSSSGHLFNEHIKRSGQEANLGGGVSMGLLLSG